ncbi:MAG: hypothetical protein AB7J32_12165 [Pseudonocardia sp.]
MSRPERPLPAAVAWSAVARCVLRSAVMLVRGRVHLPRRDVGTVLRFADGTAGRVYRETVVDRPAPRDPCALVVVFRLRGVTGAGHRLFRWESLLNTPLFVGFPGFVSKLWLAHDERGRYRGVYEWDGPQRAEDYARALWRVLALVSSPGSIHYAVLPELRRADLVAANALPAGGDEGSWWRIVGI